jgi:hypothetical protein
MKILEKELPRYPKAMMKRLPEALAGLVGQQAVQDLPDVSLNVDAQEDPSRKTGKRRKHASSTAGGV